MSKSPLRRVFSQVGGSQPVPSVAAELAHFRRSSRIKAGVLVKVSGPDGAGANFAEDARTVDVGKHGAKVLITRQLSPGATVTIDNREAGRIATGRVIWSRATSSRQSFATGLEVDVREDEEPEQVWKIDSPPADWVEGCAPPTPDERLEYLCQRARSDRSAPAGETEPGSANGTEALHPAEDSGQQRQGPKPEATPPRAAKRNANLTLLGLRADPPRETPARETMTQSVPSQDTGGLASAGSAPASGNGDAFSATEAPFPLAEDAAPLEPPAIEAPVGQVEETLREVAQKAVAATGPAPPGLESKGGSRSTHESDERAAALVVQLSEELRESGSAVVLQVREQLAHMTLKSIEILNQKVQSGSEEFRKRMAKALEDQFSGRMDAAAGEIRNATKAAVADLQGSQQGLEAALEARTKEFEQQIAESAAASVEGIARQSDALVERFQGRLDSTFAAFEQKAAAELESLLENMTTQFEQNWTGRAEKQAESMAETLAEKLRVSTSAIVEEAKNGLAVVTKSSLESVTQATAKECERQLDRIFREQSERVSGAAEAAVTAIKLASDQSLEELRGAREQMTGGFKASAEGYQEQLRDLAARGMESLDGKSKSLVDGFETRMGSSLRAFEEKAGRELDAVLGRVAAKAQEQSAKNFQAHAEETERKLREGLTASGQSVVDDARRLAGVTQAALDALSQQAAEDCRKRIEDVRSRSLVAQKQIDQASRDSAAKMQPDAAPVERRAARNKPSPLASVAIAAVLIIILVPAAIALYLFTRPVMRLRAEPPSGFAEVNPSWGAKRRALEDLLARAYWERAVQDVQPVYHYGAVLPADPPPAFQIDPEVAARSGAKVDLAASRARYWEKVRQVWSQPQTWELADTWNTEWLDRFTSSHAATKPAASDSTGGPAPPGAPADR